MRSEHRPEIDGLRAVAIVPVVLYHAGVPGFGGGYVGVDVFFVVSGFLITGILLRALQAGQFSLLLFYERRIRRLLPALVAVLVASTAAASWLLFPTELNGFGRSLAATALFLANVHFMRDAGYFAAPAESQPLLHMWSLAVEEQFYLLFPLVLAAGWRWFRPRLLAVMLVLAALSFAYALWLLAHKPDHAFYATPSRAWELLVGVALAMVTLHRRPRRVIGPRTASALTLLGLALICVPVATYSETTRFPGAMALPPVMGAALVLLAAPDSDRLISRLLTNAPVRLTGLMSYSLYLWHWPVIVFCKTLAIQPLTAGQTALMLAAVVALALCSWRFIEQPFRRGGSATGPGRVIVAGAAAMAVSLLVGVGLARGDGFPGRFPPEALALLRARTDLGTAADCRPLAPPRRPVDGRLCKLGAEGGALPSFVVWGDSHAETLFPAFNAAAAQAGASGVAFMRRGCPPLVGVRQLRDRLADCPETAEAFFRYLADHPHVRQVVLVARWAVYAMGHRFRQEPGPAVFIGDGFDAAPSTAGNRPVFERGLVRTLDRLAALGVQVTVVAQVPETEHLVPLALARAVALQRTVDLAPAQQDYQARQAVVEALFQQHLPPRQVAVLRPASVLCPADRCAVVIDGAPVYRDTNHLTRSGALALTSVFQPLFTAALPGALRTP